MSSPILILLVALHGWGLRVLSTPGGSSWSHDTLALSLSPGDTAVVGCDNQGVRIRSGALEGTFANGRLVLVPKRTGSSTVELGRWFRRSRFLRLDVLPLRNVSLGLVHAGGLPRDQESLRHIEFEIRRLLAPLRIRVSLRDDGVLDVPRGNRPFWDPQGDGFLDLRRNMDSAAPDPTLDSLVRWLEHRRTGQGLQAVVLGIPVRTGWSLARDFSANDSVLVLDRKANLPWRDESGAYRVYRIAGLDGARADTFHVLSYGEGSHRIRFDALGSGVRHRHPAQTDWVTLPGFDPGPFGFTPWWRANAPALVFPSLSGRLPNRLLARILARELAFSVGLESRAEGRNLMCPMVRPDVVDPELEPAQWRRLLESKPSP